jgi:hypothetical protein
MKNQQDPGVPPNIEHPVVRGYKILQYPRIDNIAANCGKGRILGAGLKVWSEEAPIATGGYCIGGWSTFADILNCVKNTSMHIGNYDAASRANYTTVESPACATAVQRLPQTIKGACRQPGVKGVTVRYSSLQTPDQIEQEVVQLPEEFYATAQNNTTFLPGNENEDNPFGADYNKVYIEDRIDLSSYDVITAGSYLPVVFWKYNISPNALPTSAENTSGVYTLRVMSMVHFEGTPIGDSPFMSHKLNVDYAYNHVKSMLENWEVFPPAVPGHTFKSFLKKAGHILSKVTRGASHIANILSLVDGYIAPFML